MAGVEGPGGVDQLSETQLEVQRAQAENTRQAQEKLATEFQADVDKKINTTAQTGFAPEINPEVGGNANKRLEQYRVDLQREGRALEVERARAPRRPLAYPINAMRETYRQLHIKREIDKNFRVQSTVDELSRNSNLRIDYSGASDNRQVIFRAGDKSIQMDEHHTSAWNIERSERDFRYDTGEPMHPSVAHDALPLLERDFNSFDAAGKKDGSITKDDLKAVEQGRGYSDTQRGAAHALLENDYTYFRADTAGETPRADGRITRDELDRLINTGGRRNLDANRNKELAQDFIKSKMNGKADPTSQNRAITEAYAQIYYSDPKAFKWAGLGAYASDKVGDAIWNATNLPDVALGVDGKQLKADLAYGNRHLYDDIAWQHMAYQQGGIEALRGAEAQKHISSGQLAAWELIDQGVKTGNDDLIWQGAEKIAYHEQRDVLKPMYERHPGIWAKLSSDGYAYRTNGIGIQEFPSPVDGGVTFHDFMPRDSNIANFDDRWKWTQQSIIPEWRKQEINPSPVLNSMYARDILIRSDDK